MKITDVKALHLRLPVVEEIADGTQDCLIVKIETDSGLVGLGEIVSGSYVARAVIEAPRSAPFRHGLAEILIGMDPLDTDSAFNAMTEGTYWYGPGGVARHAISGIDMALWDIKGKVLGVPCYELFGGPVRRSVPAYGNYWFMKTRMGKTSVGEYAESAARAVENGFRALKWSPFGYAAHSMTPEQEHVTFECVRQVREAVGPDVWLMVDAHGRFDLPQARRLAKGFEEYNLYFFEEPLPPENLDAFVELKRSTTTPIATGERYVARHQFRDLLEKYACDYIQPDAIYTGGMNELRKIAMMAETYYCPVIPHNCNGPVCTAATIHASACMPNFRIMEYIPVPERVDVIVEPLVIKNGAFELPTKPGLGVELNKEVFDRYVYKPRDLDHFKEEREIVL